MNCYKFHKVPIKKYGIFNESIDSTYILTMTKNGRYNNIADQLSKLKLCSNTYIVFNKGYKNCDKKLNKNNSNYDIIHFFLTVFTHANKNNYNNILVLEDDFFIEPNLNKKIHIDNINDFAKKKINTLFILSLGSIPFLILPHSLNFYRMLVSCGCHAMIYSKKARIKALKENPYKSDDWDVYWNLNTFKYTYKIPLITQTYPKTENQKNWPKALGFTNLFIYFIKKIELDKKTQPGHDFMFAAAKILSIVLILIIIVIIYNIKLKYIG